MDADVPEARDVQTQEPGAVGVGDGALAVVEVVRDALGVEELVDLEGPLRGLVVPPALLGPVVDGAGDAAEDIIDGVSGNKSDKHENQHRTTTKR